MLKETTDTIDDEAELQTIDAQLLAEVSNYFQVKYLFDSSYDTECIYISLNSGRLVIPLEELSEFINNNYEHYNTLEFTVLDLIDIYLVTMLTVALNDLTNSEFQNAPEILLQ